MKFDVFDFSTKVVVDSIDVDVGDIETITLNERLLSMHLSRMKAKHFSERKAKTRNQSEVSGTTAKPFKQKGTGNARQGTKRAVQHRGGATMFGPRGSTRNVSLPKGEVRKVKKMLVASAVASSKLFVVTDFSVKDHRTSPFVSALSKFSLDPNKLKCLMIYDGILSTENVLSSRNLRGVRYASVRDFTVHNVVSSDFIVITKDAIMNLSSCLQ